MARFERQGQCVGTIPCMFAPFLGGYQLDCAPFPLNLTPDQPYIKLGCILAAGLAGVHLEPFGAPPGAIWEPLGPAKAPEAGF